MKYDVIVIGAGPGGIFSAYELVHKNSDLQKYLANFPNFTDIPAHSLVK